MRPRGVLARRETTLSTKQSIQPAVRVGESPGLHQASAPSSAGGRDGDAAGEGEPLAALRGGRPRREIGLRTIFNFVGPLGTGCVAALAPAGAGARISLIVSSRQLRCGGQQFRHAARPRSGSRDA
jgi:hypothetical protein